MMVYVRNCWYVASWSHDLPVGKPEAIEILGDAMVLWRAEDGSVHALEDRCPHRLAPLSLGRCEGKRLRCMYHGFLIDPDGSTAEIPGQQQIPPLAKTRSFPVEERHGWVWIWMGDEASADPALIPQAFGTDDDRWLLGTGYLDYEAEASLINDNLLDFSHIAFVHANSFGGGDESAVGGFAAQPPSITPLERGVRISRWDRGIVGPGSGGRAGDGALIDWWQSYDYVLPGILIMQSASFELGSADKFGPDGPPDMTKAVRAWAVSSQAVTPTGDGRARYFFSTGPHREHGGEAERDGMVAVAKMAFAEDKVMIEAQHRNINRSPNVKMVPSKHDRAVTIFNGIERKLASAESGHGNSAAKSDLGVQSAS